MTARARWYSGSELGRTILLTTALVLVALVWVVAGRLLLVSLSIRSEPLDIAFDLVPIILFAAIGTAVGVRWTSARQATEETLRASELRYRMLLEQASDAIFISDAAGHYLEVNLAACALLGYSRDELLGLSIADVVPPALNPGQAQRFEEMRAGQTLRSERTARRKDGSLVVVELSSRQLPDGRFHAIVRDISARKAAEAERDRLVAAVEQTADTVVISDLDGRVVYVNPAFERALGYERADVVGQPPEVTDAIFGTSALDPAITSSFTAGRVWSATLPNRRKDGTVAEFDVVVTQVRDEHGTPIGSVGVGRDTSRERELTAQFHQAEKMQAVGKLAGGIAHDFNNLLTVIRGYAELHLVSHPDPGPERLDVDEIGRAADRAAELVRQLLAIGRRQAVHPERLDLAEVVTTALPLLARVVGEGIEIATQATTPTPPVLADRGQLEQVLLNLAANSRDATPDGGRFTIDIRPVTLDEDFRAAHPGARAGDHVMLAVSDTGVGMDAVTLARAFEPFFTTKEPGRGTGLGLASVYGIVKQAGGSIFGESEPGEGCTFRIYLPAVHVDRETVPTDRVRSTAPTTGTETILLVEDEPGVLAFAKRSLEQHGYSVLAFGSPAAALDFAVEHPAAYEALVTDVVMPAMSGSAVAERLRALRPGLPVLFITAYGDGSPSAPRVPVVAKPFTGTELARALRAVLDAR